MLQILTYLLCLHFHFNRFKSKENKRIVTEQYLEMRKLYRETGLTADTRKKMEEKGLWKPFIEELRKIEKGESEKSNNL